MEKYKKVILKQKFKLSTLTCNETFDSPDRSYCASIIQDYFEYILTKHGEETNDPSIRIYVNKTENGITFRIKKGYYPEILTSETKKFLGSARNEMTKDKNGENVPPLQVTEVILVHCSIVNNDYQQDSRLLYTFIPNKMFL